MIIIVIIEFLQNHNGNIVKITHKYDFCWPHHFFDQNIYTQSVSKTKTYKKLPNKQRRGVKKSKKRKTFILKALFSEFPFILSFRITPCLGGSQRAPVLIKLFLGEMDTTWMESLNFASYKNASEPPEDEKWSSFMLLQNI